MNGRLHFELQTKGVPKRLIKYRTFISSIILHDLTLGREEGCQTIQISMEDTGHVRKYICIELASVKKFQGSPNSIETYC